ncbi:MAG TPA: hypothetical protein PLH43_07245 [Acetivibrio sp.]|uniref:DUF7852 domain-containing protein n=1 Tax=Acetivibrio sp. TaxID=1872092 RepID=UPI002CDBA0F9|nr:hypothetical protein [Acetivibrio sp.]HOM02604.1 hypothetical protein [Acetivibrio sp.]
MGAERDFKEFKVETRTITEVQSEPIYPTGRCGPVLARIPVVVSQSRVHIDIESMVCFDHSVLDIYSHSRSIYLTQCKLLNMGNKRYGKIYLNGYVSENIAYAAYGLKDREYGNKKGTSADMLYKALKVPFECVTKIEYCTSPVFKTSNGFIPVALPDKENSPENSYFLGERLFCELDEASICESNVERKKRFSGVNAKGDSFDTLTEYLILSITFTLLQWQQVRIPGYLPNNPL